MTDERAEQRLRLRGAEQVLTLRPGLIYTIGSAEGCDLRIADHGLADRHALISFVEGGELIVEDLNGPGGVWIDEVRVYKAAVPKGSALRVGSVPLTMDYLSKVRGQVLALPRPGSRRPQEQGFSELMAAELRRAPWFTISAAMHLLVFWLLYVLVPLPPESMSSRFGISTSRDIRNENDNPNEALDKPIPLEFEETVEDVALSGMEFESDLDAEQAKAAGNEWFNPNSPRKSESFGDARNLFTKVAGRSHKDVLDLGGKSKLSGGMKDRVTRLRKSGLEVMFVFDSTASMSEAIEESKRSMASMIDVLHYVVPETRIGIITYRDDGRNDDYLTRSVPLGEDIYRVVNFMQGVEASGGGDVPEAVFEGLAEATEQPWRDGSQRIVILVGDAPPKRDSERKIRRLLRRFVRGQEAQVHAITTTRSREGSIDPETRRAFEAIANVGKGECAPLSGEAMVLEKILSLVFGSEFESDLNEIYALVANRREDITLEARALVRDGRLRQIERMLGRNPVPDDLVKAMSKSRNPELASMLLGVLNRDDFPRPGREAAAFTLQRMLGLSRPPIDPERGGRPPRWMIHQLRDRIRGL